MTASTSKPPLWPQGLSHIVNSSKAHNISDATCSSRTLPLVHEEVEFISLPLESEQAFVLLLMDRGQWKWYWAPSMARLGKAKELPTLSRCSLKPSHLAVRHPTSYKERPQLDILTTVRGSVWLQASTVSEQAFRWFQLQTFKPPQVKSNRAETSHTHKALPNEQIHD